MSGNRKELDADGVISFLKEGGSLRYFFLHGGVSLHQKNGEPDRTNLCSIQTFLDLRKHGEIEMAEREVGGYPYYADNHKSSVYKISVKSSGTPQP